MLKVTGGRQARVFLLVVVVAIVVAPSAAAPADPSADVAAATVQFVGDWESGDLSQWTWTQCTSAPTPDYGTLNVVTRPVARGKFAARFDLPASDRNHSCEVLRRRTLAVGSDDWYGLEVRLPMNWQSPSRAGWGLVIAQFNFQGIWGAPVSLVATAGTVNLVLQSGLCNDVNSPRPGCAFSSGTAGNVSSLVVVPQPIARDRWHQLIVHVKWASDSSGLIEAWHRLRGSTKWIPRVRRNGWPTVQWSAQRPPTYQGTVDKIGAYRGKAAFPLSVWHDTFVVGASFGAVAAKLR